MGKPWREGSPLPRGLLCLPLVLTFSLSRPSSLPEPCINRKESSLLAFLQVPQGKQVSRTSPLSVCVRGDALGATGQREQRAG